MEMDKLAAALLLLAVSQAYGMMIEGNDMTMDDAIIKAGSNNTKMYEIMHDENTVMVELDMLFPIKKYEEMRKEMDSMEKGDEQSGGRKKRKAIIPTAAYRWTNERIPYEVSGAFTSNQRQLINAAIEDYRKYTCLRFVPATSSDRNRVRFQSGGGCSSYVGMIGGTQPISLAPGCRYKGIIIHEMGHAIGFQHEQTRSDRDSFVYIQTQNIQSGVAYNFMRYTPSQISSYGVPYDYTSVMHYSQYAFSSNGRPTILARDNRYQNQMGNREGLSFNDIKLVNLMYDCAGKKNCANRGCPSSGFQGQDCKCYCDSGDRSSPLMECSTGSVTTEEPSGSTVSPTCSDTHDNCPTWARRGFCTGQYEAYMKKNCKYSCQYCSITTTAVPTTTTTTAPGSCRDESTYCSYWARTGECSRNPSYMLKYCKKSCDSCSQVTTPSSCRDTNTNCPYWTSYCKSSVYSEYLRMTCPRSCNYCTARDENTSTTTESAQTSDCVDRRSKSYCEKKRDQCGKGHVSFGCQKTCGVCQ